MPQPAPFFIVVASALTSSNPALPGSSAFAALSRPAGHTPYVPVSSRRPKPSSLTGHAETVARLLLRHSPPPLPPRRWPMLPPESHPDQLHQRSHPCRDDDRLQYSTSARLRFRLRSLTKRLRLRSLIKKEFDNEYNPTRLFGQLESKYPNSNAHSPLPPQRQPMPRRAASGQRPPLLIRCGSHASFFLHWARGVR